MHNASYIIDFKNPASLETDTVWHGVPPRQKMSSPVTTADVYIDLHVFFPLWLTFPVDTAVASQHFHPLEISLEAWQT